MGRVQRYADGLTNNWERRSQGVNPMGIETVVWQNKEAPDKLIFEDRQEAAQVSEILDFNHHRRQLQPNPKAAGRLAASIPITVYCMWKEEWKAKAKTTTHWKEFLRRKLNEPEFAYFRVGIQKL